ncbi:MAG: hypothetical protein GC189_01420 [Alphaproteobacteria bacterium]|nr:hypothetical protein [Alphaproteobacteria bacterium]
MRLSALAAIAACCLAGLAAAQDGHAGVVIDARAAYPEGPLWQDGRLFVAEMGADRVSAYDNMEKSTFFEQRGCGPTALAPHGEGFAILCHIGQQIARVAADGAPLGVVSQTAAGRAFQDPNDISADDAGGAYFSDPGLFSRRAPPHGYLVYLDAAGAAHDVARGLWYPNGVYFDAHERALFVSETFRHRVLKFPVQGPGRLGPPTVFAAIDFEAPPFDQTEDIYPERGPDGLERGPDGLLYVAIYGEGVVVGLNADGAIARALRSPARYTTNIAFAPDGAAYVVGASLNDRPPFTGEVRRFPPP